LYCTNHKVEIYLILQHKFNIENNTAELIL